MPHASSNGQTSVSRLPPANTLTIPNAIKRLTVVSRDLLLGLLDYSYLTDEQVTLLYTAVVKEFFLTAEVFEFHGLDVSELKTFPDALRDALESVLEKANAATAAAADTAPLSYCVSDSSSPCSSTISSNASISSIASSPNLPPQFTSSSSCSTLLNASYEVSAEDISLLITELIKNLQALYKSSTPFLSSPSPSSSSAFLLYDSNSDSVISNSPITASPIKMAHSAHSLPSPKSSKTSMLDLRRANSVSSIDSSPYLFLEWSKNIKKVKLHNHQLDFPSLHQLFYIHFRIFPHNHPRMNSPKLYICDPQSHVYYELEDLGEVHSGSLIRMEPFEMTPPRVHLGLLRSPSIQQKHPLRTIKHLREELLELRKEVLGFQKDHQTWCQTLHHKLIMRLQLPHYHLPSLPELPSTTNLQETIEPLYLVSEQMRYDLCERRMLPNKTWLAYLSAGIDPANALCQSVLHQVQETRSFLKPYWAQLVKKVVSQQTHLKDLEKTVLHFHSLVEDMNDVQTKLERALALGTQDHWAPKPYHPPTSDPQFPGYSAVVHEIQLVSANSSKRMLAIDAFKKLADYKLAQVCPSEFEVELRARCLKGINKEKLDALEGVRENCNQKHLLLCWELQDKHRRFNDSSAPGKG